MTFLEHSRVRLKEDKPSLGLAEGAIGAVVHVYEGAGYEVEFQGAGLGNRILTLHPDDLEHVAD